jgi:hypothetical protein
VIELSIFIGPMNAQSFAGELLSIGGIRVGAQAGCLGM